MQHVPPGRGPIMLGIYAAAGLAFGLAMVPMQQWLGRSGLRPGIGVAVQVNLTLPLVMAVLAAIYPRLGVAVLGGLLAGVGLAAGTLLGKEWHFWMWTGPWIAGNLNPIVAGATVGYAVVAAVSAALVRPWRRMGLADADRRCKRCGYLLDGVEGGRCPECGGPADGARPA